MPDTLSEQDVVLAIERAKRREPIGYRGHVIKHRDCKACSGRGYFLLNAFIPDINMCASPENALQCVDCAKAYLDNMKKEAPHA